MVRNWRSQLLFPHEGLAHLFVRESEGEMEEQRVMLWCKVLGRLVEVVLREAQHAPPIPGVPAGWVVKECLAKDTECFGKGCPFTTDGGELPFGEVGEFPDLPPETFDLFADPSFEGESD